jgi:hypothetical protein
MNVDFPPGSRLLLAVILFPALFSRASAVTSTLTLVSRSVPTATAATSLLLKGVADDITTAKGIVAVVLSPNTPSFLIPSVDEDAALGLSVVGASDTALPRLMCRGATLAGTSDAERISLSTCSAVANTIILDGVTEGDLECGLSNTRHARTLASIFRARLQMNQDSRQTLIVCVGKANDEADDSVLNEVRSMYKAAALERKDAPAFDSLYDVRIVPATSEAEGQQVSARAPESRNGIVLWRC